MLLLFMGLIFSSDAVGVSETNNPLAGKSIAIKNQDGHLELFKVDADGVLRHRWQNSVSGDWSSWNTLGTDFEPGIAIATNSQEEIVVFAVNKRDRAVYVSHESSANSHDWSDWANLGGKMAASLAAGNDADGKLEVFAADYETHGVKRIFEVEDEPGWSDWRDMGGAVEQELAVASNPDGRLELFGISVRDKSLVHCSQCRADANAPWTQWSSLGGFPLPGFVVRPNVLGKIEAFAVFATDGHVHRTFQTKPGDAHWTRWEDFGLKAKPGLAIGQSKDRRLELMAVSADDSELMHKWEILPNGIDQWSVWDKLGIAAQDYPVVVADEDGDLEVFATDVDSSEIINHRRQISHSSGWLDWARLEHPTFQYSSRTWQTDEGLPNNNVEAIAQGRDGYLWVGTQGGLARFNGLTFASFAEADAPELGTASISALCADRHGALWVGTRDRGLYRIFGDQCTRFSTTNGLAGNCVNVIFERRDGSIWVGTATGLTRLNNGSATTYGRREGLSSDAIRSLLEDRDGNLWIATGEGLNQLQAGGMDFFPMPPGLPNDAVRCICQDRGGRIWIGSNNGMLWYGSYWKQFFAYNTRYGLSDPFVSAICEDREGNLWVGTYSGLNRFREGRFLSQLDNEGVPFDHVNALFEDRESNIWVGSKEGLIRLTPKRFTTLTKREGLTHNNAMAVTEHESDSLWVGTWGGGVCIYKDGQITPVFNSTNVAQTLVLSLAETHDRALWVGADFDAGLTRFGPQSSVHFTFRDGLPKAPVRVLHEDSAGALWIGTDQGLCFFSDGKFRTYTVSNGLPDNVVRSICDDPEGGIWIGTGSGLSHLRNGAFTNYTGRNGLSDSSILSLYEDSDHALWIGTAKGGLNRLTAASSSRSGIRITYYTTRAGLFSDEVLSIVEDDEGWLWMSCSRGVFRIKKRDTYSIDHGNRDSLVSLVYGKSDGMESTQCNGSGGPSAIRMHDGHLCFCTSKGVAIVDPDTVTVNFAPPPVRIEQVLADRKPVLDFGAALRNQDLASEETRLWNTVPESTVTKIPPGRGDLEFDYAALTFQSPEDTRFKYRLAGVDSDWVDAGTRRTAHYNNVAPGRHSFRVLACNKDGAWNERGATIVLELEPHIWQTWWWRAALIAAIVGSAAAAARYATNKRVRQQLAILEQRNAIERERGRIAKDIHDDLGSSLTLITMLGERAEEDLHVNRGVEGHIGKIVMTARHTVRALDEIVWAVNPENDTLDGLVQYISHYADEVFENSSISCRLDIPAALPDIMLTAELRHDLFLIVKEAFHNVLKHSNASQVRVRLDVNDGALGILIEDNGRGFNTASHEKPGKGNGLRNMEKRARAIHSEFSVTSEPGKGCAVHLSVPLSRPPYVHTIGSKADHG
jgi:ligand-binding sensor domain-containing protein/signal transduction histidine kinase